VSTSIFTVSCKDGETYAEKKKKEEKSIGQFIQDNDFVGKINPITEEQFYAQDSMTDLSKNEFVRFNSDGIYMQIVRKGEGPTMAELARQADTTVTRFILCKFLEYDIQGGDTTCTNMTTPQKDMTSVIDEMRCTYSPYSRSYTGSFTKGEMGRIYDPNVPTGWLKPLDFIRLTKVDGEEAKVRIIVPHSSGTINASGHVQPFYYEITYMISPNY
jgi:hypothetical protein